MGQWLFSYYIDSSSNYLDQHFTTVNCLNYSLVFKDAGNILTSIPKNLFININKYLIYFKSETIIKQVKY